MRDQKPLTARQRQVLDFMRGFFADNDQLPPTAAIRARFGWNSDNAVHSIRSVLEEKGYLEHNTLGKYRFTRGVERLPVIAGPGVMALPVVDMGRINGGRACS